eukprot:tig00020685_g12925.t1
MRTPRAKEQHMAFLAPLSASGAGFRAASAADPPPHVSLARTPTCIRTPALAQARKRLSASRRRRSSPATSYAFTLKSEQTPADEDETVIARRFEASNDPLTFERNQALDTLERKRRDAAPGPSSSGSGDEEWTAAASAVTQADGAEEIKAGLKEIATELRLLRVVVTVVGVLFLALEFYDSVSELAPGS